jgi:hypothetical protein
MPKILVCDDESDRAGRIRQRLRAKLAEMPGFELTPLSPADFMDAVSGLEKRQRAARDSPAFTSESATSTDVPNSSNGHLFDDVDILFVDYDLVRLGDKGGTGGESGERVCYLARCYSRCGTIVAYNQFTPNKSFDLTLRGHLRSFADLNLTSDSVGNSGLWSDEYTGFRPWAWPMLIDSHKWLERRTQDLLARLDEPIVEVLGFNKEGLAEYLTREQLEFLSLKKDPKRSTVHDFVAESSSGLRPKDQLWEPEAAARIAAARISKWLERAVLSGQNLLVDAPHLVSRFPSLVTDPRDEGVWNASCRLLSTVENLGFDTKKVEASAFGVREWLSRPAWIWPKVSADESISEVRDPWSIQDYGLVFCEDVSRFRSRKTAHGFVAELGSEFSRRYVQKLGGVSYEPAVRFLM